MSIRLQFIRSQNFLKRIWFSWYWILLLATGIYFWATEQRVTVLYPVLGVIVSAVILTQRQKLDELNAFRKTFDEFNKRYDELEPELVRILRSEGMLNQKDRILIFRYFNLCAEEFLYFKRGLIPNEVWKSWQNGARAYFKDARYSQLWDDDSESDSYYGYRPPFE